MRTLVLFGSFLFLAFAGQSQSNVYVSGYVKSDGTFVQGHWRQSSNSTNHDNWSTVQQYNPYTNSAGSRARDYSNEAYNYGAGNTIYSGSRGGQYYYNSNGNKVYVPKRNGF